MKIACIGGGPGGLYFAISMKLKKPEADISVIERNKAADTFGWGVVLSDETLDNLKKFALILLFGMTLQLYINIKNLSLQVMVFVELVEKNY